MKKILVIVVMCLSLSAASFAQDKAIGLKLGTGAELSGQLKQGDANRIEANLGLAGNFSYLGANGYYQWLKELPQLGEDFNWFYGAGASLGIGSGFFDIGVGAQLGLEYKFPEIPLQLSIDVTPTINVVGGFGFYIGSGLGVRYTF